MTRCASKRRRPAWYVGECTAHSRALVGRLDPRAYRQGVPHQTPRLDYRGEWEHVGPYDHDTMYRAAQYAANRAESMGVDVRGMSWSVGEPEASEMYSVDHDPVPTWRSEKSFNWNATFDWVVFRNDKGKPRFAAKVLFEAGGKHLREPGEVEIRVEGDAPHLGAVLGLVYERGRLDSVRLLVGAGRYGPVTEVVPVKYALPETEAEVARLFESATPSAVEARELEEVVG